MRVHLVHRWVQGPNEHRGQFTWSQNPEKPSFGQNFPPSWEGPGVGSRWPIRLARAVSAQGGFEVAARPGRVVHGELEANAHLVVLDAVDPPGDRGEGRELERGLDGFDRVGKVAQLGVGRRQSGQGVGVGPARGLIR